MNIVKQYINEKFSDDEDSDPITDMNIGMIHQIKKWMKSKGYDYIDKDNALIACSRYKKIGFVKYLLDAGADVHANNDDALRWASYHGHTEVVKLLLDAGADVHVEKDYALRFASYNGHIEVVKLLLDAGADVHAYNDYALRWASQNGHTEVVKLLLDAGADVHANYDYALRWASENGRTEVVKLLKDHIAKEKKLKKRIKESLNEKFSDDEDSDPIADMGIGTLEYVKYLMKKYDKEENLDIDEKFLNDTDDLLWTCSRYNKADCVRLLLKLNNVDIHKYEDRALRWAAYNKNVKIAKLLLDAGANVKADKSWSIKIAKEYKDIRMLQLLKKYLKK